MAKDDAEKQSLPEQPIPGVFIGVSLTLAADTVVWASAGTVNAGSMHGVSWLLAVFPVIVMVPVVALIAVGALAARRPWVGLGALIGLVGCVLVLPGQCVLGHRMGWV